MKNDNDNGEKRGIKLDFKDTKNGAIYGNNEKTTEKLEDENLYNIINKRLTNIIIYKIKNEEIGIDFYKMIEEQNISETYVFQILKYLVDLIPILLKNKNKCHAMQTGSHSKIQEIKV